MRGRCLPGASDLQKIRPEEQGTGNVAEAGVKEGDARGRYVRGLSHAAAAEAGAAQEALFLAARPGGSLALGVMLGLVVGGHEPESVGRGHGKCACLLLAFPPVLLRAAGSIAPQW